MKNITTDKIVAYVNQVAKNNQSIITKIESSKTTNSVYVTLFHGSISSSFRISDHNPPCRRPIKNLTVKASTTSDHVMRFITNCFESLKYKATLEILNNISKH